MLYEEEKKTTTHKWIVHRVHCKALRLEQLHKTGAIDGSGVRLVFFVLLCSLGWMLWTSMMFMIHRTFHEFNCVNYENNILSPLLYANKSINNNNKNPPSKPYHPNSSLLYQSFQYEQQQQQICIFTDFLLSQFSNPTGIFPTIHSTKDPVSSMHEKSTM